MKKFLCLILAFGLLIACCSCGAKKDYSQYGDSAVIEIGNVKAKAGKTVKVAVKLQNNPGAAAVSLEMHYDTAVLTPISAVAGSKVKNIGYFQSNLDKSDEFNLFSDSDSDYVKAVWFNAYNFTDNGEIMVITFQVADDAEAGVYPITVEQHENDIANEEYEYVDIVYLEGSVTVS